MVDEVYKEGPITKDTKLYNREEKVLSKLRGRILDVGCSGGRLLVKATVLGHDIIGIDRDILKVREAEERAKLSGVEIRAKHLSTDDEHMIGEIFDTIVMGEVIEHTLEPQKLIVQMLEYLKPDGQLLITTPAGMAHFDADHKSFFITRKTADILTKHWMIEFLPLLWFRTHRMIIWDT